MALNTPMAQAHGRARQLNQERLVDSLDTARLAALLAEGGEALWPGIQAHQPHLFSSTVVFAATAELDAMVRTIAAIEAVVALPAYQAQVLSWAGPLAASPQAARGVFMGYDFHLGEGGPQLIEINTNAGGGLLAATQALAQQPLCPELEDWAPGAVAQSFLAMFRREWQWARGRQPLNLIAIVDSDPEGQYLAPEFELFRRLFAHAGLEAVITDPGRLQWDGTALRHEGRVVDMVYKRLTDFALDDPAHLALRQAYAAGAVVMTPHPRAHGLYADKRNLVCLSDSQWLAEIGVEADLRQILAAGIPPTVKVSPAQAEQFWAERRRWFFKPAAGFGSRAAYRGDKLTKRVFEEILAGDYIAQEIVPPSLRRVAVQGEVQEMKVDIRNYVYQGQVQQVTARLYQGQTTNFRTPGGGFAPVVGV